VEDVEDDYLPRSSPHYKPPGSSRWDKGKGDYGKGRKAGYEKVDTTPEDCFETVQRMSERAGSVLETALLEADGWIDGEKLQDMSQTTEQATSALQFGTHYFAVTKAGSASPPDLKSAAEAAAKARTGFRASVERQVEKHRHLMQASYSYLQQPVLFSWLNEAEQPQRKRGKGNLLRYTKRRLTANTHAEILKRTSSSANIQEMLQLQKQRDERPLPLSAHELEKYGKMAIGIAVILWLPLQVLRVLSGWPLPVTLVRNTSCFSGFGTAGYFIWEELWRYLSGQGRVKVLVFGMLMLWVVKWYFSVADAGIGQLATWRASRGRHLEEADPDPRPSGVGPCSPQDGSVPAEGEEAISKEEESNQ